MLRDTGIYIMTQVAADIMDSQSRDGPRIPWTGCIMAPIKICKEGPCPLKVYQKHEQ